MGDDFDCTGNTGTSHSCSLTGLSEGVNTIYVACKDDTDASPNKDNVSTNEFIALTVDVNSPPNTTQVFVNASSSGNTSLDSLYCFAKGVDAESGNLSFNYTWFNGSTPVVSGQATGVANNTLSLVSTLTNNYTRAGDIWVCSVTAYDGEKYEGDWNNASAVTITNGPPVVHSVILNATTPGNYTSDNLTGFVNATEGEGEDIAYIYTWYRNGTLNATTMISDGLMAYLPFNSDYKDYAGVFDATNNGSVLQAGVVGNAASFNRSQYLTLPANFPNTTQFSISLWVNMSSRQTGQRIFEFGKNSTTYMYLTPSTHQFEYYSRLAFGFNASGSAEVIETSPLPASAWTHVAVTLDNTVARVYVNSTLVKIGEIQGNPNDVVGANSWLGRGARSDQYLHGMLDEVLIYGRSLSAAEVDRLYQGGRFGGNTLGRARTKTGDVWVLGVKACDAQACSQEANSSALTIRNKPPETAQVYLNGSSSPITLQANLTCYAQITDIDNTLVYANYTWYNGSTRFTSGRSGPHAANQTKLLAVLDSSYTSANDSWTCSVLAYDGNDYEGVWRNSSTVNPVQVNSPPVMAGVFVNSSTVMNLTTQDISCYAKATDANNDRLNYTISWYKNGVRYESLVWNRTISYGSWNHLSSFAVDSQENIYLTSDYYNYSMKKNYLMIDKFDSSGTLQWSKPFLKYDNTKPDGIVVDSSGNILVMSRAIESYPGKKKAEWILKLDPDGVPMWNKTLFEGKDYSVSDLSLDSQGNMIAVLHSYAWKQNTCSHYNYVVKMSPSGEILWNKPLDATSLSGCYYISGAVCDGEDNIIVFGHSTEPKTNNTLIKLTSEGEQVWIRNEGGNESDWMSDVTTDPQGNIYLIGNTQSFADPSNIYTISHYGYNRTIHNYDIWLLKYDKYGNLLLNRAIGSNQSESGISIDVDEIGSMYVAGSKPGDFGSSESSGMYMYMYDMYDSQSVIWYVKFDPSGNPVFNQSFHEGSRSNSRGVKVGGLGGVYIGGSVNPAGTYENDIWLLKLVSETRAYNKTPGEYVLVSKLPSSYGFREGDNFTCVVYASDGQTLSGILSSGNITVIDLPQVVFTEGTTASGSHSLDKVKATVSAIDSNLDSVAINLYNSSGLVNSSTGNQTLYSAAFEGLADGVYYLNATAGDAFGNANKTETRTIILDSTPPVITVHSPADGSNKSSTSFNVTVTVTDYSGFGCALYAKSNMHGGFLKMDSETAMASGQQTTFTADAGASGVYSWYLSCTDNTSKTGKSTSRTITLDSEAPEVGIKNPVNGDTVGNMVYIKTDVSDTLSGVASATFEILNASNPGQVLSTGNLSPADDWNSLWNTTSLGEIQFPGTLRVNATDNAGNTGSAETNFSIDNVNPTIQFITPPPQTQYYGSDSAMEVIIQDSNLAYVQYNITDAGGAIKQSNESLLSSAQLYNISDALNTSRLGEGRFNLTVYARDSVNNKRTVSTVFIVDLTPPAVSLNSPADDLRTTETSINFNWTAADNIAETLSCNLTSSSGLLVTGIICANNTPCNLSVEGFSWGNYSWSVSCRDSASNWNTTGIRWFAPEWRDEDGDEVHDSADRLAWNKNNVSAQGFTQLNITVNGSANLSSFNQTLDVVFYDQGKPVLNFTHDFENSILDLSRVSLTINPSYILANLSGQVLDGKALYLDDENFSSICVVDAETSSIASMSPDCTGSREIDFASCIGNSAGLTKAGATCRDLGSRITVSGLMHSAVKGFPQPSYQIQASLSSSLGGNKSSESLNCYATVYENASGQVDSVTVNITWFNGSSMVSSAWQDSVPLNQSKWLATIPSALTSAGENWTCSVFASDAGGRQSGQSNATVSIAISPPSTESVSLTASNQYNFTTDNLSCYGLLNDSDSNTSYANITWFNDTSIYSSNLAGAFTTGNMTLLSTLDSSLTQAGENWSCAVNAFEAGINEDVWTISNAVAIRPENSLPQTVSITVNTSTQLNSTYEKLYCYANITDADGGTVYANITWLNGSTPVLTGQSGPFNEGTTNLVATLASGNTSLGETWTCSVLAFDGISYGADAGNASLTILSQVDTEFPGIQFSSKTTASGTYAQKSIKAVVLTSGADVDTIKIYLYNSTGLCRTSSSNSSRLSTTFDNLPEGSYTMYATVNDTSGNTNQTETRSYYLDGVAPQVSIVSPGIDYSTSARDAAFVFSVQDYSTVNCILSMDSESSLSKIVVNSTGLVSAGVNKTLAAYSLSDRRHAWHVNCTDALGNSNKTSDRNLTVDSTPPQITIETPTTGETLGFAVHIKTGITDELSPVTSAVYEILNASNTGQVLSTGNLSSSGGWDGIWNTSPLGEVQFNVILRVSAADSVGNNASVNKSFSLDNVNPSIQFITPPPAMKYYNTGFNLSVIVQDFSLTHSSVNITNTSGSVLLNNTVSYPQNTTSHSWTETVSLGVFPDGVYNTTVYALDNAGNNRTSTAVFTVDATPPALTVNGPSNNNRFTESSVIFNWTISDNIAESLPCNLSINGRLIKSSILCANNTPVNYPVSGLYWSDYDWNVSCSDNASNVNGGETLRFTPDWRDLDGDEVHDYVDFIVGNEDNISKNGTGNLSVQVNESVNISSQSGESRVVFYDNDTPIVNFTHNFSEDSKIDLRNVSISVSGEGILVNFSGQLTSTKTLSVRDNGFSRLCVKDADVAALGDISSTCDGAGEIDFTICLGNSSGVRIDYITCIDEGSIISVSNLEYSAIKGVTTTTTTMPYTTTTSTSTLSEAEKRTRLLILEVTAPEAGVHFVGDPLEIRVIDERTDNPVDDASVYVYLAGTRLYKLTTDDEGAASFTPATEGVYLLRAEASGYRPAEAEVSVLPLAAVSTTSTITRTSTLKPVVQTTSSITASSTSLKPVRQVSTTSKSYAVPEVVESIKEEPKLFAGIAVSLLFGGFIILIIILIFLLLAKKRKKDEETSLKAASGKKK